VLQVPDTDEESDAMQQCFVNDLQPLTQVSQEDLALIFSWLYKGDNVHPEQMTQELLACMEATPRLSQEHRDTLLELLMAEQRTPIAVEALIADRTAEEQEANSEDISVHEVEYCGAPCSCSCTL